MFRSEKERLESESEEDEDTAYNHFNSNRWMFVCGDCFAPVVYLQHVQTRLIEGIPVIRIYDLLTGMSHPSISGYSAWATEIICGNRYCRKILSYTWENVPHRALQYSSYDENHGILNTEKLNFGRAYTFSELYREKKQELREQAREELRREELRQPTAEELHRQFHLLNFN